MNNRLIDIERLSRYHENLKNVLNTKEEAGAAAQALADAKEYADGEIAKLSFDEAGAAAQALQDAKDYADGKFQVAGSYEEAGAAAQALQDAKDYADGKFQVAGSYEEAGAAAQALDAAKEYTDGEIAKLSFDEAGTAKTLADAAEQNAKDYADGKFQEKGDYEAAGTAAGLNAAMDERVLKLEAIDHEKLAADASAAAVATVLDGAPESFDTLKEVAAWIGNNDHASDVAALVTDVANLKAIDHEAYKGADETVLQDAKDYADNNFVKAEGYVSYTQDEKDKLAGVEEGAQVNVIETLEVNGVAATIEDKKAIVTVDCYTKDEVDAAIADFATKSTTLSGYGITDAYTKDELDTIIGETERVAAEALTNLDSRVNELVEDTYSKNEIDTMVGNVIVIASDDDIDNLFA